MALFRGDIEGTAIQKGYRVSVDGCRSAAPGCASRRAACKGTGGAVEQGSASLFATGIGLGRRRTQQPAKCAASRCAGRCTRAVTAGPVGDDVTDNAVLDIYILGGDRCPKKKDTGCSEQETAARGNGKHLENLRENLSATILHRNMYNPPPLLM